MPDLEESFKHIIKNLLNTNLIAARVDNISASSLALFLQFLDSSCLASLNNGKLLLLDYAKIVMTRGQYSDGVWFDAGDKKPA